MNCNRRGYLNVPGLLQDICHALNFTKCLESARTRELCGCLQRICNCQTPITIICNYAGQIHPNCTCCYRIGVPACVDKDRRPFVCLCRPTQPPYPWADQPLKILNRSDLFHELIHFCHEQPEIKPKTKTSLTYSQAEALAKGCAQKCFPASALPGNPNCCVDPRCIKDP